MRTTNHPLEPEELMAYLDGELPSDRAARAAEHLGSCHECQEIAADLRGVSNRLLEWRVETPVIAAPQGKAPGIKRPFYQRRLVWGLAAVGVVGVVLIGQPRRSRARMAAYQMSEFAQLSPAPSKPVPITRTLPSPSAPLIAHTANLTLVAHNFDRSRDALQEILNRHHGYIAQMTVNAEEASARSLNATLKTPDGQLDATMAEIKALGRVLSESRGGEEVTQQSMDLDARLANARHTEERLTDLLQHRTDKLADILAVENQISDTRGQIEQMEAERKNLTNRVEYAKIEVRITEEYKAQLDGARTSMWTQLRNAAVEGYTTVVENLLGLVTGLLAYGPLVLVWCAILYFPARFAWRRFARS
jgi:Domain of unknown function (DUF4349)/Putative zinc-finger